MSGITARAIADELQVTEAANSCECEHTFWEVSSRCLPECPSIDNQIPAFEVTRCEDGQWQKSSIDALIEYCLLHRSHHKLVVYVHGNWMDASDARTRARRNFKNVSARAQGSVTFVAYTWPSQRKHGYARDVLEKKDRIDAESYYLSKLLAHLECDNGPGVMGFSFGGRVLMGALHILHGGALAGRRLETPVFRCMRVSLFAPAFDRDSLTASGRYNQALYGVERIVNLYNSRDPVLRRFRFFDRDRPIAAGFAGLPVPMLAPTRADKPLTASPKIVQYDCQNIGRSHAELDYFKCSAITIAISNVLGQ